MFNSLYFISIITVVIICADYDPLNIYVFQIVSFDLELRGFGFDYNLLLTNYERECER